MATALDLEGGPPEEAKDKEMGVIKEGQGKGKENVCAAVVSLMISVPSLVGT
jgi:hypothetical protein